MANINDAADALAGPRERQEGRIAASPHSSEPRVKTTMPIANRNRRPKRSASAPAVSSRAARESA